MKSVGQVRELYRYPVKSFAGESLPVFKIEPYGVYGDRCYAFRDETKDGWNSYITARQIPEMLSFKTTLEEGKVEDQFPILSVWSPDGQLFSWNEELLSKLQSYSKAKLSMMEYSTTSDLLAVDSASILIVTDSSLRKLEALWGHPLDQRRFRANLIVSIEDDSIEESEWIGKRLVVGSAEFLIDEFCERCSMITLNPDTLERDSSLLKRVNEQMNLNFGLYASVRVTGQIQVGDRVYLKEEHSNEN